MARITRDGEPISLELTWALGFWLFDSEMGAAVTAICFFVGMGSNNSVKFS